MRCRSVALVNAVKGPDGGCDLWTELVTGPQADPRKPLVVSIEIVPAGYLVVGDRGGRMLIPHANVRYAHLLADEVVNPDNSDPKVVSMARRRGK